MCRRVRLASDYSEIKTGLKFASNAPGAEFRDELESSAGLGRKSGMAPDYSYSVANKNSGITRNKDQFLEYIKDPQARIPGTKMTFAGIKNEKEANDLWAYIPQFDKDGKTK